MRQTRWRIWLVICAAVVILGISYYYGAVQDTSDQKPALYSVILYQHTDGEWNTMLEGAAQAEKDFNVRVHYVTMGESDTAAEQAEMIQREVQAGTSGILMAAVDSEGMAENMKKLNLQIPVITVETGTEKSTNISADNYAMGQTLGGKILDDMKETPGEKKVTIVREFMERESVRERYRGLVDALASSGEDIAIEDVSRQKGDFSLQLFIGTTFADSGGYVAALDKFCTEEAAAAWESQHVLMETQGIDIKLYGIGNTAQTVNDLDNEKLRALVYQNEFNMGYEGIQALVEKETKGYMKDEFDIRFMLVTKETLYDSENERLLFSNI